MSRLAYQALIVWDDPRQFEATEVYASVHKVLSMLFEDENALTRFTSSEYLILETIVAGSMDAVSEAIRNNPDSEAAKDLVEILEDLIMLTDEIKAEGSH